jgi:hypothetical protein
MPSLRQLAHRRVRDDQGEAALMESTFRVMTSRAGIDRAADFDAADAAWDAFAAAIREGDSVYLYEAGDLIAYLLAAPVPRA